MFVIIPCSDARCLYMSTQPEPVSAVNAGQLESCVRSESPRRLVPIISEMCVCAHACVCVPVCIRACVGLPGKRRQILPADDSAAIRVK